MQVCLDNSSIYMNGKDVCKPSSFVLPKGSINHEYFFFFFFFGREILITTEEIINLTNNYEMLQLL